jgi:hypothetical protein
MLIPHNKKTAFCLVLLTFVAFALQKIQLFATKKVVQYSCMIDKYRDFIINNQLLDGGFGYYKKDSSLAEPGFYCLLALIAFDKTIRPVEAGIKWLLSLQNNDGGWLLFKDDNLSSPLATALALIVLAEYNADKYKPIINDGKAYLEKANGFHTTKTMSQNAWGWNKGGFISIEPSAYAVIGLRKAHSTEEKRIKEAEQFFLQNRCESGGWTYGYPIDTNHPDSKKVYSIPLTPQIHITALVLMAAQGRFKPLDKDFELIIREYDKSYCPLSLALSVLAFNSYGQDARPILNRLNEIMLKDDYLAQMPFYNALSLLANLTTKGINPLCLKT